MHKDWFNLGEQKQSRHNCKTNEIMTNNIVSHINVPLKWINSSLK